MERRIKLTWTRTVQNTAVLTEHEARSLFGTPDVLELPGKMAGMPAALNDLEYDGEASGISVISATQAHGAETEQDEDITYLYEDKDRPLPGTGRSWERTGPFPDEDSAFEYWAGH